MPTPQLGQGAGWRKSSASGDGGGGNCVEVRFDDCGVLIRDSKYLRDPLNDPASQPIIAIEMQFWPEFLDAAALATDSAGTVPSIERTHDGGAVVRAVDGTTLTYTSEEWEAFVAGIRSGEFSFVAT